LGLRPEHFAEHDARLDEAAQGAPFSARVSVAEPTGADILLRLPLGTGEVTARVGPRCPAVPGERLALRIDLGRAVLFDGQSEQRLA
ncbi:TOBE domain-containing protein, partial [Bacillus cereus group sp. BC229]|uniref:TOBE domain-containing protein n=1 Tax=Bacillus cereus group sp. BC229 TaxID=3445340 RepID=UPI003F261D37